MNRQQTQNRRWKVFNKGALRLRGGIDIPKIGKNSRFNLGAWSFVWRVKSTKAPTPWRQD